VTDKRDAGNIAVADAVPLIHLDELGVLDLLSDFAEVWIPQAVVRELERHRPAALRNEKVPWVRRDLPTTERLAALASVYTLHAGEQAALALCMAHPEALLLTDDTAARLAAQTLALRAHGTLRLLIRAERRGQLRRLEVLALL